MRNPGIYNKTIAKTLAHVFGGTPRVQKFWDDNREQSVDILRCENQPQKGVTSFATIGLSDWPLIQDGEEYPVRIEILGVCGSTFQCFDNAISTAAFCIINSGWFCSPGTIFPDIFTMYKNSTSLQHMAFTSPFLWGSDLKTLEFPEKNVAWLLAVPISG